MKKVCVMAHSFLPMDPAFQQLRECGNDVVTKEWLHALHLKHSHLSQTAFCLQAVNAAYGLAVDDSKDSDFDPDASSSDEEDTKKKPKQTKKRARAESIDSFIAPEGDTADEESSEESSEEEEDED